MSIASWAWRWAPTTTSRSPLTRASSWRASTPCCAARRRRPRPARPAPSRAWSSSGPSSCISPAAPPPPPPGLLHAPGGLRHLLHPRRAGPDGSLPPASLLWRPLIVRVAALVVSQAAALWLLSEQVTKLRAAPGVGQFVGHLKTKSAEL